MFGLSGTVGSTDALQKFRGSLRSALVRKDTVEKSISHRAFRDSDGTYQSSHHGHSNRPHRISTTAVHKPVSEHSAAPRVHDANVSTSVHEVRNSNAQVPKHQCASIACSHKDFDLSLSAVAAEWRASQCTSEHSRIWDQRTLNTKLETLQTLSHQQLQLLSKVAAVMPDAASFSDDFASHGKDLKCDEMLHGNLLTEISPLHQRPPFFANQLPALKQLDVVAVQLHRCVTEMRQRIDELSGTPTEMRAFSLPSEVSRQIAGISVDVQKREWEAPLPNIDSLARQQAERLSAPKSSRSTLRPHVSQLNDAQQRQSPLANRVKNVCTAVHATPRGMMVWQGVPHLHPCFVAVAEGDYSLLLSVQQVKKEDKSKCVSLNNWNSFLRHSKAFTKLGISQNVSKHAFELALLNKSFAHDEYRVNFYGFCQVDSMTIILLRCVLVQDLASN